MKYLARDKSKRFKRIPLELRLFILKLFFLNKKLPVKIRFYCFYLLSFYKNSIAFLSTRCLLTGRSNGVYKRFGLSRLMIRREGAHKSIPGLRKHSW